MVADDYRTINLEDVIDAGNFLKDAFVLLVLCCGGEEMVEAYGLFSLDIVDK